MIETGRPIAQDKAGRQDWLILSDSLTLPASVTKDSLLDSGLFVAELTLPLSAQTLLLEISSTIGWPRTFSLFYEPTVGLVLLHRQGQRVVRHVLPGPFPEDDGQARVCFRFDAPARQWDLSFELLGEDETGLQRPDKKIWARGRDPLPLRIGDISELATRASWTHRDPAILWFGLSRGRALPNRLPWIGPRTPIETSLGPRMAGQLQAGDLVRTLEGGFAPLISVRQFELPSCGSFASVLLRAPYFGEQHDLLMSSDQQIVLSGPEVEYLFGSEEVLIKACELVDGHTAILDQRRTVTRSVALYFDRPILAVADGCAMLCQSPKELSTPSSRSCLRHDEAITLMALLGRAARGKASAVRML
mgnify:CR=1 FL=1